MIKKITIAYIIDCIDEGGTGRQLKFLLESLDKDHFDPRLFILRDNASHQFVPNGIDIETIGVNSFLSLNAIKQVFRLARRLKADHFQIVQTFFQDATLFGVIAAKIACVPAVIISVRDQLFWSTPFKFFFFFIMLKLSKSVLVNSLSIKNKMASYVPGNKIHVIQNGLPEIAPKNRNSSYIRKQLGIEPETPLIVLVSNCNRTVKRVDLLIESIPKVLQFHTAHFLLVGDGHLRPGLESRSIEIGISRHITFAGHRHDVLDILSEADVALNTSDSEGLSNAVMEAMQSGLPIVASDVAGNRELIEHGHNGFLFTAGDSDDLATKIITLLENVSLRQSMGVAGKSIIARKHSIQSMIKQYVEYYVKLLNIQ